MLNILRADGGGVNPEENSALAAALKRAKEQGVPKDNIENALKKVRRVCARQGSLRLWMRRVIGCRRERERRRRASHI